jgi:hypothetical protein
MAFETTVTAVSAYHNYKYRGVLRKELLAGREGGGFFLHAREAAHPDEFPRISLTAFTREGVPAVVMRDNRIIELARGFTEERRGDGMSVRDAGGNEIFGYTVTKYQNVYVTEVRGEFFDEKGEAVIPV